MKKSLLAIAALAAGFTMSAQQTVFFSQNFDFVNPWAVAGKAGNVMEDNNQANTAPNLETKAEVNGVEVACIDALNEAGYQFLAWHADNQKERVPAKQIYLQKDYLKFGLTGYQSGIILPSIDGVPAGTTCTLNFDTCPQRRTANDLIKAEFPEAGPWDDTHVVVEVKNGEESVVFEAITFDLNTKMTVDGTTFNANSKDADGNFLAFKWYPVSVKLEGVAINKDTQIIIRNGDNQLGHTAALRWYLNNMSLVAEATGIDAVIADENAPVEYFNLQGIRVNEPANGLYIRRQGNAVTKVMVK